MMARDAPTRHRPSSHVAGVAASRTPTSATMTATHRPASARRQLRARSPLRTGSVRERARECSTGASSDRGRKTGGGATGAFVRRTPMLQTPGRTTHGVRRRRLIPRSGQTLAVIRRPRRMLGSTGREAARDRCWPAMVRRMTPLLAVALNGSRVHPLAPRTPGALAEAARTSVDAGAGLLHLHPFDAAGSETLAAGPCGAALEAVRATCPGVPISLSTSAAIEPDPGRRRDLVAGWTALPDLVTANQGEAGIRELCDDLIARGVGIEAGLLSLPDAGAFLRSGLAARCVRVLIEPLDADPRDAVAHAAAIEAVLVRAGIGLEQVHHGDGLASWAVNARALPRGHGIRTGLEDTTVLPDGRPAPDNAALVRAAAAMMAELGFNLGDAPDPGDR